MRFVAYQLDGKAGIAARLGKALVALDLTGLPSDIHGLVRAGPDALHAAHERATRGAPLDESAIRFLPPVSAPPKIICVGLNYADHTKESPYEQPDYPTLFPRFTRSLIGHEAPIVRPLCSEQLDYEGEVALVIGHGGRHITRQDALAHVAGYSIFNDASIRDYQFKSPQWTVGKNFEGTGAFGPDFVTADELPPGASGLRLVTRLNGATVQSANTDDILFDVPELIATISEVITLEPGDVIVTGTPAGVGFARKPPLFMKDGDVCEVEVEGLGILRNTVRDEGR